MISKKAERRVIYCQRNPSCNSGFSDVDTRQVQFPIITSVLYLVARSFVHIKDQNKLCIVLFIQKTKSLTACPQFLITASILQMNIQEHTIISTLGNKEENSYKMFHSKF